MKGLRKFFVCAGILLLGTGLFAQDWFVCVGSYSSNDNADELVYSLQKNGISSFIYTYTKENGSKLFRVLIDEPFTSRDEARTKRDSYEKNSTIKSLGLSGLWICQADKIETVEIVKDVKPAKTEVKIVLEWSDSDLDLDSSLITSNILIDFENPDQDGIRLEYDEDADYAPETITISDLNKNSTYQYFVQDYDNYYESDSTAMSNSGATVKLYVNNELKEAYIIAPATEGTTWHVFDITGGEFVLVNSVNNDAVGE